MELKTPLYQNHVSGGGKIVPFAGYLLPVQYEEGVITEHNAVRTKAGLFDVSHMAEVTLKGSDALKNLQYLLTNDFTNMVDGQVRYTPMCNPGGGIIDDLLVYKIRDNDYMLVVNASNRFKDVSWIKKNIFGDVQFEDISDDVAQIALQGPRSLDILRKLADEKYIPVKYYSFIEKGIVSGIECIVSQTGYTGEGGFEFYCKPEDAPLLWDKLLEAGKEFGLILCGLGARDTLRLEAAMPLHGHEMTDELTPLESDLGIFVKMDKVDFIGKSAILKKTPISKKRVGLKLIDKGIAREESKIYINGKEVGITTSGTYAPYLGYPIAMAIIEVEYTALGTIVQIDVRGRLISAEVVKLPFYKKG